MNLMLISDEQEVLLWAVNGTISDIRTEIGHTDNQAMREDLHKRKTFLPYSCSAGMPSVRTAGSGMSWADVKGYGYRDETRASVEWTLSWAHTLSRSLTPPVLHK